MLFFQFQIIITYMMEAVQIYCQSAVTAYGHSDSFCIFIIFLKTLVFLRNFSAVSRTENRKLNTIIFDLIPVN